MAAALGADLILDVQRGRAELDEAPDRARDVERARAEARVHVHQQWQIAHVRDAADVGEYVVQRVDAQIRHAERAGRHAAAGQVDRLVADLPGQQGVVGVDRADDLQRLFFLEGGAKPSAGRRLSHHESFRSGLPALILPASCWRLLLPGCARVGVMLRGPTCAAVVALSRAGAPRRRALPAILSACGPSCCARTRRSAGP